MTRLPDGNARLRVFIENNRFVIDISSVFDESKLERTLELVRTRFLPCVGASDIQRHSGWE